MVSALWKACASSTQDVDEVQRLLSEPGVDVEIQDQAGVTPLIQAVKNGHKEVVKVLLGAGADPTHSSSEGRPEIYTHDPEMLAMLQPKQETFSPQPDPNALYNPGMPYYYPVPPPGPEGPYPPYGYPMMPPPPPEGQPPVSGFLPAGDGTSPGGVPNLPPADIARTIPCRYFPVCRYGSSCMFLHPQPPYFSGPPPPAPAHYAPPMYPPHVYYMMRPGSYPPPPPESVASPVAGNQPFSPPPPFQPNGNGNNAPPFSPGANGAPFPPPPQVNGAPPFPNGAPYPPPPPQANGGPYPPSAAGTPYTPISAGTPSPFGPPPFSPGSATPFSTGAPFTPGPYAYPPRPYTEGAPAKDVAEDPHQHQQPQQSPVTANGTGNHPNGGPGGFGRRPPRGTGGRRESFGTGRQPKPACLFFPSGRCRNGDECRFPHVLPEPGTQPPTGFNRFPSSNNTNNRFHNNHNHNNNPNHNPNNPTNHRHRSSMSHHDGPPPAHIPPGTKLPFADEPHTQKVPSADDFPVLGSGNVNVNNGSGGGGGGGGLTAAQVLQAPPPQVKKKVDAEVGVSELADALSKVHVNGLAPPTFDTTPTTPEITAVGA